jgi:uncharacterized membrane protein
VIIIMKHLLINVLLIHVALAFLGKAINLYLPALSENSVVEVLNMNQRKIVTTSVIVVSTVALAQYLIQENIKIKSL